MPVCDFQNLLYYFIVPGALLFTLLVFGFGKKRIGTFFCNQGCRYLHRKLGKEKSSLFEQIHDLRKTSKNDLTILEIGAGCGMNFNYFPKGTNIFCLEPNPIQEKHLRANLEKVGNNLKLAGYIQGFAENIPQVKSESCDAVVCTLALCSVQKADEALAEVKRVLKPGGKFLFLEHVAGERGSHQQHGGHLRHLLQHILHTLFSHKGHSHKHGDIWSSLENAGFSKVDFKPSKISTWIIFFSKDYIYGTCVK